MPHGSDAASDECVSAGQRRVMVLADGSRPHLKDRAQQLIPTIERYVDIVSCDFAFSADFADEQIDFVVVLGGDGSILRAARSMGESQKPVIGINLGRLGFLAHLPPESLDHCLAQVCAGQYRVVDHLMFAASLWRDGKPIEQFLGLNEVSIHAGPPFAILDVQLYIDSELATTYSCDGLIVSTPVGSTAHSLSAGGPILRKSLEAFVISPISPHTLTNRPVVDSADHVFELAVPQPHAGTSLVIDGQLIGRLQPQDKVRIERAKENFRLVELPGQGYYQTLREKLGWGGRLRNDSP